jgi:redox-sensitive bicupin YhaK (pirin superfamily)
MSPTSRPVAQVVVPEPVIVGHRGTIGAGDMQWMTSGSGILHEEMLAPQFLDVTLPAGGAFRETVPRGHTAFAYVDRGEVRFGVDRIPARAPALVVFTGRFIRAEPRDA